MSARKDGNRLLIDRGQLDRVSAVPGEREDMTLATWMREALTAKKGYTGPRRETSSDLIFEDRKMRR